MRDHYENLPGYNGLDARNQLARIDGLSPHNLLPWLFCITDLKNALQIIDQVLAVGNKVGVEVGCGYEPTRTYLINPGLWFAFDASDGPEMYFQDAQYDFSPSDMEHVPPAYQLILAPIEFYAELLPAIQIHTYLVRNPNYASSSDLSAFEAIPRYENLVPGQRVVIVRDNNSYGGRYEHLLGQKGYPRCDFLPWNHDLPYLPLTSERPSNREVEATVFDYTKV